MYTCLKNKKKIIFSYTLLSKGQLKINLFKTNGLIRFLQPQSQSNISTFAACIMHLDWDVYVVFVFNVPPTAQVIMETGPRLKVSSDRLVKPGKRFIHYTTAAP